MEKDFGDRVKDFANELMESPTLSSVKITGLIGLIHELAKKHNINVVEKDLGEQKLSEERRSWRRYQVWLNDPNSFEGKVFGQSDLDLNSAYAFLPRFFTLTRAIS